MGLYSGYIAIWHLANPDKTPPPEPKMTLRQKLHESRNLIPVSLLILFVFVALGAVGRRTECAAWGSSPPSPSPGGRLLTRQSFWRASWAP